MYFVLMFGVILMLPIHFLSVLLLLGVCFVAEGPLSKLAHKQTQHEGTGRSYDPGSFGIVTCIETKGCTDLKRKRPISP
jgi:hypothetical protein